MLSNCTLCGSSASETFGEKLSDGRAITVLRCKSCGNRYLKDWAEHLETPLYDYYADDQWREMIRAGDPFNGARYHALLADFEKKVSGRDLLDIGCGAGHFVAAAVERGWNARGLELGPAADFCKEVGLPVERLDLFSDELSPGSFDVVSLFEVAEHVPDPGSFIRRAVELLRPGGLFYATVPNGSALDGIVQGMDWPVWHVEHVTYFSPTRFRRVVERAGARVVRHRVENISPETIRRLMRKPVGAPGPLADLRTTMERPRARLVKQVVNHGLSALGLGNTIKVLARKPA